MKLTEDQDKRRAKLLRIKVPGDDQCVKFTHLDAARLQALVDEGLATLDDKQNNAPTLGDVLALLKREPKIRAHGYAVARNRDDCRVSIEGIHVMAGNGSVRAQARLREVFQTFCRDADDLRLPDCGNFYAWWD